MRIAIIALGSQGDVQPYMALGRGLQGAGHEVRLITHENFQAQVRAQGLEFWPVQGNVQELLETEEMRDLVARGNFLAITLRTAKEARKAATQWAQAGLVACRGMDLILAGLGGMFVGLALADKLRLPFIQAHVLPFTPTRAFPGVLFPPFLARFGGVVNRSSHVVTRQIMWQGSRSSDHIVRRNVLNLPASPWRGPYPASPPRHSPTLYGFSPSVIPKPPDWDRDTHVTGYWFLDPVPDWLPPARLVAFLQAGPPPIYIGFGSMSSRHPEETARLVLQAVAQTGQRAILLAGWSGMRVADLPENVLVVDSIPHAWLFPRVAAVVHHGGAGTTAAGLRAGVPTVVIPFFGDQPFWGGRIQQLGRGPPPSSASTSRRIAWPPPFIPPSATGRCGNGPPGWVPKSAPKMESPAPWRSLALRRRARRSPGND